MSFTSEQLPLTVGSSLKLAGSVPNADGRTEYDKTWHYPVLFISLDTIYLGVFIVLLLLLRFLKKLTFDRFQISCLTLFCLTFLCKCLT